MHSEWILGLFWIHFGWILGLNMLGGFLVDSGWDLVSESMVLQMSRLLLDMLAGFWVKSWWGPGTECMVLHCVCMDCGWILGRL